MAVQFVPPFTQFFGTDGLPLASGKIYTYDTGTTTPRATYSDALSTATNANPVILDSHGRASIFLTSATAYRIVVKTSADVTISTTDNVYASGEDYSLGITLSANLDVGGYSIVSSNNGNINITPHGTGVTKIDDPTLVTNANMNGYNIVTATGKGILSAAGTETQLLFTDTASAVNYLEISSSVSGEPIIEAKGTDSNIGITLLPKGTGVVFTGETFTNGTDDTFCNANYPTTSLTTEPDSVISRYQAGARYIRGTDYSFATRLVYEFVTGTPTIVVSTNVSSLTDNGTGDITINFTSNYSNANYAPLGIAGEDGPVSFHTATTSSLRVLTWYISAGNFVLGDYSFDYVSVTIYGRI